eukprot:10321924-Ditylum_brightwellii.AAC.1
MKSTLVIFKDTYYNHKGVAQDNEEIDVDDFALSISAHEATFCADLSVSYLFEMHEIDFHESCYKGMYCNDRTVAFDG